MKFTAVLPELQRLLQTVIPAVPPKSTLPALENFLLHLEENTLTITATDQEITIVSSAQVAGEESGSILAPARRLLEIVKALGNTGNIGIEANNKEVILKTNRGEFKMFSQSPDIFPTIPQFQTENEFTLTRDVLSAIATKTIFAASKDEFRPAMTGVLFEFDGSALRAVATDGYRLVRMTRTFEGSASELFSAIIPSRAVELLKKPEAETMKLAFTPTHGIFTGGNTTIITRLIDERFPAYQNVIPNNNDKFATFVVSDAVSTIKRVALFANKENKQIIFDFKGGTWNVVADDSETGSHAHETIECEYSGDDLELGINFGFILESLSHVSDNQSATVQMSFSSAARPALLMPMDENEQPDDSVLMLVMPLRIS